MYLTIHPFKLYNTSFFAVITELHNHDHNQFENTFLSSKKRARTSEPPALGKHYSTFRLYKFACSGLFPVNGLIQYEFLL